jgi:hypothetical protein
MRIFLTKRMPGILWRIALIISVLGSLSVIPLRAQAPVAEKAISEGEKSAAEGIAKWWRSFWEKDATAEGRPIGIPKETTDRIIKDEELDRKTDERITTRLKGCSVDVVFKAPMEDGIKWGIRAAIAAYEEPSLTGPDKNSVLTAAYNAFGEHLASSAAAPLMRTPDMIGCILRTTLHDRVDLSFTSCWSQKAGPSRAACFERIMKE